MSDSSKSFAVRRWATSTSVWTPIVCPIACTQIVIENTDASNAQAVRSDPNDSSTEKNLPASLELTLRASSADPCWNIGDVVCSVLARAGAGPICVTFLR